MDGNARLPRFLSGPRVCPAEGRPHTRGDFLLRQRASTSRQARFAGDLEKRSLLGQRGQSLGAPELVIFPAVVVRTPLIKEKKTFCITTLFLGYTTQ